MTSSSSAAIYIGIGTNLGDRMANITKAIRRLSEISENNPIVSNVYQTSPWGNQDQPDFLNCVAKIKTNITPTTLMNKLEQIEGDIGKVKSAGHWQPRPIDLDILIFGDFVSNEKGLAIPHIHLTKRKFVLKPLADIAATLVVPGNSLTVQELLQLCDDPSKVELFMNAGDLQWQ